jgi:hypothetical protein
MRFAKKETKMGLRGFIAYAISLASRKFSEKSASEIGVTHLSEDLGEIRLIKSRTEQHLPES